MVYSPIGLSKPAWYSDFWEHKEDFNEYYSNYRLIWHIQKMTSWIATNTNSYNVLRKQMRVLIIFWLWCEALWMFKADLHNTRFNLAQNQLINSCHHPRHKSAVIQQHSNVSFCIEKMAREITEPSGSDVSVYVPEGRPHASACKSRQLQHKTQVTQEQLARITEGERENTFNRS